MEKACNDGKLRVREYGPERAKKLGRRLDDLRAANCLADMAMLPQTRCHQLIGDRNGQISVDLDHPYRLLFVVADDPIPRKLDGGLDWSNVTSIEIIGVEDTHG